MDEKHQTEQFAAELQAASSSSRADAEAKWDDEQMRLAMALSMSGYGSAIHPCDIPTQNLACTRALEDQGSDAAMEIFTEAEEDDRELEAMNSFLGNLDPSRLIDGI